MFIDRNGKRNTLSALALPFKLLHFHLTTTDHFSFIYASFIFKMLWFWKVLHNLFVSFCELFKLVLKLELKFSKTIQYTSIWPNLTLPLMIHVYFVDLVAFWYDFNNILSEKLTTIWQQPTRRHNHAWCSNYFIGKCQLSRRNLRVREFHLIL